jgi:hypothetical protein
MTWRAGVAAPLLVVGIGGEPALAYRPFDGTDAAVAGPGEFEAEIGPLGYLREGRDKTLVVPQGVLNLGLVQDWELVLQGRGESSLSRSAPFTFGDTGVFVKHVLRDGVLQDKPGLSIATEIGVLTPGIGTDHGAGASVAGIVSQRWPWMTAHLNVAGALTRDQHADLFAGTILEGPSTWPVRPVAELFAERQFARATTLSGLIGAIWQLSDDLAVDVGVRRADVGGHVVDEIRAGLTFSFGIW